MISASNLQAEKGDEGQGTVMLVLPSGESEGLAAIMQCMPPTSCYAGDASSQMEACASQMRVDKPLQASLRSGAGLHAHCARDDGS